MVDELQHDPTGNGLHVNFHYPYSPYRNRSRGDGVYCIASVVGEATPTIGLLRKKGDIEMAVVIVFNSRLPKTFRRAVRHAINRLRLSKTTTDRDSRSNANCATILVRITEWVRRRGAQSKKSALEGLTI